MLKEEIKGIDCSLKKLREFGLLVGAVFGLIALLVWWKGHSYFIYLAAASVLLIFLGWISPKWLKSVYQAWMTVALLLGWVMTRVILSIVFYLTVTPIALLARVLGNKFLDLEFRDGKDSYWIRRETQLNMKPSDFEKQF